MSCVRVGVVIGGVHDVMHSRGDVWDGDGGSRELYGCVCVVAEWELFQDRW